MDIIHLLPDSVANQIAAGEVIQRPASVVKELVENAIDAGASSIDVVVQDAGRTLIQVVDDGKGMSDTDARMAFERHATSKIQKADDLFSLRTMGFRGEALPSIAAVAHVEMRTRTLQHEVGTEILIDGSQLTSQTPCSCPVGTNFLVRDIFFNVPARRKFLKSNQTELSNIVQEFERIALVNPSVAFSLTHNGNTLSKLPTASLRTRVLNIFGRKFDGQLLDVDVSTTMVRIRGFVGKPESARKKGAHQYFFVNGRYMRHPYFAKAVAEAFSQIVSSDMQVPYFLYFEVDPAEIDVNIHPTKTEIKFENEQAIWQILMASVREVLGQANAVPMLEFDTEGRPEIPVFQSQSPVAPPVLEVNTSFNPFRHAASSAQRPSQGAPVFPEGASLLPDAPECEPGCDFVPSSEDVPSDLFSSGLFSEDDTLEMSTSHIQLQGQYILTPVRSGLMIVHQQRAHMRIRYDQYRSQMDGHPVSTQGLLFPELVQLPPSDAVLIEEITDELHQLGFDISPLGGGTFSVNGMPAGIEGTSPSALFHDIVRSLKEEGTGIEDEVHHRLAMTMARNSCVVRGQVMDEGEMDDFINQLFACSNPNYTPDGRLIVTILKQEDVDKIFA